MHKIDSNLSASPTWMFPHTSVSNRKEKLKLQKPLSYFAFSVIKTNQLFEHFIFFVFFLYFVSGAKFISSWVTFEFVRIAIARR